MLMSERSAISAGWISREPMQHLPSGGGEMHHIGSLANLAAKALVKEVSDIRLVVHDQDTGTHAYPLGIVWALCGQAAAPVLADWKLRGRRTVNSVNAPTLLSDGDRAAMFLGHDVIANG
jgi:hypothetical protein